MTRADICDKVRARIDELSPFASIELNPSISLIDSLLNESTTTLLMFLPLYLLEPETFSTSSLAADGRIGKIELPVSPNEFLRLYSFKMEGWDTEVTEAIGTGHPLYKLQKNPVTMGGPNKPVVVIKSIKANKMLHYYSVAEGAAHIVLESLYIQDALPEDLDDTLTDFIAWSCATDVLLAMEQTGVSDAAKKKLMELVTIKMI